MAKLIYLALLRVQRSWCGRPVYWPLARDEFDIQFGERFPRLCP